MTRVPIPLVVDADFFVSGRTETAATMRVGSHTWYSWLSSTLNASFAFRGHQGVFTARLERQRHGWYWYAYRKLDGKTHKAYLGKSEELTRERLAEVATQLASKNSSVFHTVTGSLYHGAPFLPTKFAFPTLHADYIVRQRLFESLEGGRASKLMMLSAAAGWGKTTLLSAWCAQLERRGQACAWISLDEHDADPVVFWTDVIVALQSAYPDLGAAALALLRGSTPLELVLRTLLYGIATGTTEVMLVLDDCQHLTQALQSSLTFFIEHVPSCMHLVMAGRMAPPLSLARLRVQGQLFEISASDLAITPQEAYAWLVTQHNLPLSLETCRTLVSHTEGWAAGLHLALLTAQNAAGPINLERIATFSGAERYMLDYLIEEIVLQLPTALQDFLLHTAIVSHFNAALCDAVRLCDDSQLYLEALARRNLCLVESDHVGPQLRYYRLLTEALRARLHKTMPTLELELHRRASRWYEQQGMLAEALQYAQSAADEMLVARLRKQKEQTTPAGLAQEDGALVEPLTGRERAVLALVVDGASNREIAQHLVISEGTVKKHVSNICNKLSVQRRTQAITRALALALI